MKTIIDPGRAHTPVTMREGIIFSHVTDLEGKPLDLPLTLLSAQALKRDGSDADEKLPTLIWVNGGGWRTTIEMDNAMLPEFIFLAQQGYNVVFFHYRNSDEGKFPAQIVDLKTCIRFLRANAGRYGVDPDRIGVFGRSAGGHLTSFAAMNTDDFISEEWPGFSTEIQCAIDMFGPVDLTTMAKNNYQRSKEDPNCRWKNPGETAEGMLLKTWNGDLEAYFRCTAEASPVSYISDKLCPLLILHGDADPVVPLQISEDFYEKLLEAGLDDRTDFYIVKDAGHGTPEFFQDSTKELIADFFDKHLKG